MSKTTIRTDDRIVRDFNGLFPRAGGHRKPVGYGRIAGITAAFIVSTAAPAQPLNLARAKTVRFAPAPAYRLTIKGDTDATDLTDGALTRRTDNKLWFDAACVGWSYPGLAQLSVDLGKAEPIGEVAIRLQGGSPQAGIAFPGWVDLGVSLDGMTYHHRASYSKWRPGDKARYGVPPNEGKAWVHKLTFRDVNIRARYVGLSFYGSGLTVADELYVMRGTADAARPCSTVEDVIPMATSGIGAYFHKPHLMVTTNIATPTPVGILVGSGFETIPFDVILDLPAGMRLRAGGFGRTRNGAVKTSKQGDATRCAFSLTAHSGSKNAGRLYFGVNWQPGKRGEIRYQTRWAGGATPICSIPVEAIEIPPCPVRSQRLMLGLGWWSLDASRTWPNVLDAFQTIGFTTVPLFARWTDLEDGEVTAFLERCRERGFSIVNIDSPFHHMLHKHRKDRAIYCQFADGTLGTQLCPSYRGPHYHAEIQRLARETAAVRARYLSCDIELWGWRGPVDAETCTRCQAGFKASGHTDIKAWQQDKGYEIWRATAEALKREAAEAGIPAPDMGGYDFRPGGSYQFFWPFDRLYPQYMQCSQVSTYTPLEPYHIALIGDAVRRDRAKLPRSDVLPWITPGDAGTFPGEAFRCALLECFCNGARGVYFWSGRVWDAESLAAFAGVIRTISPIEDIFVDGELLRGAAATPPMRVSGMRHGHRMAVLVADYAAQEPKTVALQVPITVNSVVSDAEAGRRIGTVTAANPVVTLTVGPYRGRLLLVEPERG